MKKMNELLVKKELNENTTYSEFLEDMDCLFQNLEELYGMYDYFGKDKFESAHQKMRELPSENFALRWGMNELRKALKFVKDGHFSIGEARPYVREYAYAVRYSTFHGIPMIDCKKLWADDDEEEKQLEEFANKGADYRNDEKLIIDFRGNYGGSSTYIFKFLEGLTGGEVGFSSRFLQRWSGLYTEYLLEKGVTYKPEHVNEWEESKVDKIPNEKIIYVLFDERSASAAEEGIAILRNMENVVLVGNHSAGMGTCGNCLPIYLPHSHIRVYFGTGLLLYEGIGNVDADGGFKGDISYEDFENSFEDTKA